MKIYVVSHYYNNGESYEDYREYEEHKFYSTLQLASEYFWASVAGDYHGKFVLTELELDTQQKKILEESVWIKCEPYYNEEWQGDYEPEYEPEDYYPDPMKSYKEYWRYEDYFWYQDDDISEEEEKIVSEYLNTPGTNYREWEEVTKEIEKRKSDIFLDELNSMLVELLK